MNFDILSAQEIRRYSQQLELPDLGLVGQERIKQAKILVIGAGSKGTSIMQHLVSAGIGKLGISDNMLVKEDNLPGQTLYGTKDIGKQKAIISRQHLLELNHHIKSEVHNICLVESNISDICKEYDVIIDATDNFPAHYLINDAAIKLGKPFIYGSINTNEIYVSIFNYQDGPSFRCLYPEIPAHKTKPVTNGIYNTGILGGIAGAIMANETMKIILGKSSEISGAMFILDISSFNIEIRKIDKDPQNFQNANK